MYAFPLFQHVFIYARFSLLPVLFDQYEIVVELLLALPCKQIFEVAGIESASAPCLSIGVWAAQVRS